MEQQLSFSIVNTAMAVRSMRDSGYKSTTLALAELVDNSIEAGATSIEIVGVSRIDGDTKRMTLKELSVLDNGHGMGPIALRRSLRYGDGTRTDRKGIGRFGLGLPNSSMSQARRVDVWSWQRGISNALHTHLAISDVEGGVVEIPKPVLQPLPRVYREAALQHFGESGTLVVWSDLDRVKWKRAATTFRHTEQELGRIYRRFVAHERDRLHPNDSRSDEIGMRRAITCVPVEDDGMNVTVREDAIVQVRPNDPLYLMSGTSCPKDFGSGTMFEEHDASPFEIPVVFMGEEHHVRVRASYARPWARNSESPGAEWPDQYRGREGGNTPWGKHAGRNIGISIVRAHRELELDQSWIIGYDPRERWWKIEIDLPTALDEVFGVTNNKQSTTTFQSLSKFDWKLDALEGETEYSDVRKRMDEDGDPRVYLLDLHRQITRTLKILRQRVKQSARRRRYTADEQNADAKATAKIKKRSADQHRGRSDELGDQLSPEEQKKAQEESLRRKGLTVEEARVMIEETNRLRRRVRWILSPQESPGFFDVESLPHLLQVAINMNHPVHSDLYEVLHPNLEELDAEGLRDQLTKAAAAFRLLVYAWARYEDEQPGPERRRVRNARWEWGKYAELFFVEDDDEGADQNAATQSNIG